MAEMLIGKRHYHAFLSHAHVDKIHADALFRLLSGVAKIPIWYDAENLPPGATIAENLFQAIESSRAVIVLLSRQSVERGWAQQESRTVIDHQTRYPDFRIIPLLLDNVEPPNFLQNYSSIRIDQNGLDAITVTQIIKALYQPLGTTVDPSRGRHTYLSRGWHPDDLALGSAVTDALSRAGLCLVGDAEDHGGYDEARVAGIMDSCGAFVAVLPFRPKLSQAEPHTTSKYVLREWKLAADHDLPCLVIPHPGVELPEEMAGWPGLVAAADDASQLLYYAMNFAEEWRAPRTEAYFFHATDFDAGARALRTLIKEAVEAATALPCRIGEYVEGASVQKEILRIVKNASMVLADISGDSPNVYIEVGAARAASVPVALLRRGAPGRPTFMLRDQQVWDYAEDAELIARAVRVSYPYRRLLLT
jgi:hypothetical protein